MNLTANGAAAHKGAAAFFHYGVGLVPHFAIIAVSILFDGLAYAMFLFITSVGLSVTMGLMGFVNLAHGAFAMAGGYVVVSLTRTLGIGFHPIAGDRRGRGRRGQRGVRARALSPAL